MPQKNHALTSPPQDEHSPRANPARTFVLVPLAMTAFAANAVFCRKALFSGSTGLSLQRTLAICGALWRGSSAT